MFATQKQSFHNKGIQTYVALIGTDKYNFISEFYQCVTEANDDIVILDPDSPSYTTLTDKLCKDNGYDLQITEVNPETTDSGFIPFVEIWNRGAPADIQACFGDTSTCSTATTVGTGEYLIASTSGSMGYGDVEATLSISGGSVCTILFPKICYLSMII